MAMEVIVVYVLLLWIGSEIISKSMEVDKTTARVIMIVIAIMGIVSVLIRESAR